MENFNLFSIYTICIKEMETSFAYSVDFGEIKFKFYLKLIKNSILAKIEYYIV